MNEWLAELVELYEYRVADVLAGEPPRGDRQSFGRLREALLSADGMDATLRKRVRATEQLYRDFQRAGGSLPTGPRMDEVAEQKQREAEGSMKHLTARLWHYTAEQWLLARMLAARFEPRLMALRLVYSSLDTLSKPSTQATEAVLIGLDEAIDICLTTPESIGKLTTQALEYLGSAQGRQKFRKALKRITQATASQLAEQIAQEDRLLSQYIFGGDSENGDIATRSEGRGAQEERRSEWAAELELLTQTAQALEQIAQRWARGEQSLDEYHTKPHLLAKWPDERRAELPTQAQLVGFTLPQPLASEGSAAEVWTLVWGELQLTLRPHVADSGATHSPVQWEVELLGPGGTEAVLLRTDLPVALQHWQLSVGAQQVQVLTGANGYALLRRDPHASPVLAYRAQQIRLGSFLVQPHNLFAHMRLARAAALTLRGRTLEGHDFSPASARKYLLTPPEALGHLAERGMSALLTLSADRPTEEVAELLASTAEQIGLARAEGRLLAELITMHLPEPLLPHAAYTEAELPRTGPFMLLSAEGVEAEAGVWALEQGHIEAKVQRVQGGVAQLFINGVEVSEREQLIWPTETGTLLAVRAEEQWGLAFAPK